MTGRRHNNEGSIYWDENRQRYRGAVSLGWRGGRAQRKYFSGRTEAEVQKLIRKALQQLDAGETPPQEKETVSTYLDRWLTFVQPRVRHSTYLSYEAIVRKHLKPGLGGYRLSRLSTRQVQEFLDGYGDSDLSPRRVAMLREVLRNALNQAMRWGELHRNAAELADPPRQVREPVRPLSVDEARAFLAAAKGHRLEALFVVGLALGLRVGEAVGLRWEDVDLDGGWLQVRKATVRVRKEGLRLEEPKTRTSSRPLPLPPVVVGALREHRKRQAAEKLQAGAKWQESGHVFTTSRGRPLAPERSRTMQSVVEKAKITRRVRFHDLRHSCASLLLAEGLSPVEIKETLGHSSIGITLGTYSHLLPGAERRPAEAIQRALGGPTAATTAAKRRKRPKEPSG